MIIKRVPDPRHSASVSTRIRKLTDYIVRPDLKRPREKCLYAAARGFFSETLAAQQLEMVALATVNPKVRHPVTHYIMSWQDGEVPSAADIERAVDIFQAQLGIDGCQVIYGLHVDTGNLHLHLCLNRVHPDTERPIRINGGFDIEACHQAIARIEAEQGWAPEVHTRYVARSANVYRTGFTNDAPEITQKARDGERRTGTASVQQQVHHALSEVLGYASTWAEFHAGLARFGIAYVKKGNGAVCVLDRIEVKPSSALRKGSIKVLEKLFGPFQIYEPDEIDDEIMPIRWPEPARHCSIKGGAGGALGLTVDGFECRVHEGAAYYSRRLGGAIEFIDRGSEIEVTAFRDEEAVLAALRLAAQKWPGDPLVIEGEPDFRRLVVRLAAREGLTLADPELQRQVEAERQMHARAVDIADVRRSELALVDQAIRHLAAERCELLAPAADRRRGNRASSMVARSLDANGFSTDSLASAIAEAEAKGIPSADLALVPLARDKVYLAFDHAADIDPSVGDKPIAFRQAHHGLPTRHLGVSVLQPPNPDDALISGLIADHFEPHGDRISVRRDLPGALSLAALEQGVTLSSDAGAAVSACPTLTELLQEQQKARADTAALLDDIGLPSRQLLRETPEPPAAEVVPPPEVIAASRRLRANMDAQPIAERRVHPSRIDADLAMQLRVIGYPREEVVAVIAAEFAAAGRDDAWITPDLYADRIADSAFGPAAAERFARAAVYHDQWIQTATNAAAAAHAQPEAASAKPGETTEAGSLRPGDAVTVMLANGKLGSRDASPNSEIVGKSLPPSPPQNQLDEILTKVRATEIQVPLDRGNEEAGAEDVPSRSVKPGAPMPKEPGHPVAKGRVLNPDQVPVQTRNHGSFDGKSMPGVRHVATRREPISSHAPMKKSDRAAEPGSKNQATLQPDTLGTSKDSLEQRRQPSEKPTSAPQQDTGVLQRSAPDLSSRATHRTPETAPPSSSSPDAHSSRPPPATIEPVPAARSSNTVSAIEETIGLPASGRSGAAGNRPNPEGDGHTQPDSPFLRLLAKLEADAVAGRRDADAGSMVATTGLETETPADKQTPVPHAAPPTNASPDPTKENDAWQGVSLARALSIETGTASIAESAADTASPAEAGTTVRLRAETPHSEDVHLYDATPAAPTPPASSGATAIQTQDDQQPKPSPAPVASGATDVSASEKLRVVNNTIPGADPLPAVSEGFDRSPRTDSMVTSGAHGTLPSPDGAVEASSARAEHDRRADASPKPVKPDPPIVTKSATTDLPEVKKDRERAPAVEQKAGAGEILTPRVQSPASPPPKAPSPLIGAMPSITNGPGEDISLPRTVSTDPPGHERPQQFEGAKTAVQKRPSGERQPREVSNPKPPIPLTTEQIKRAPPAGEDKARRIKAASNVGEQARSASRDEPPRSPQSRSPANVRSIEQPAPSKADPRPKPEDVVARDRPQDIEARLTGEGPKPLNKSEPLSMPPDQGTRAKASPEPTKTEMASRSTGAGSDGNRLNEDISERTLVAARRVAEHATQTERDQPQAQRPPKVPLTAHDAKPSETPASNEIAQRPKVAPSRPMAPDPIPPVDTSVKETSPENAPLVAGSSMEHPAAQDIRKNQADPSEELSRKGDRSEAQTTQARPPKAIQLPPPVPIVEIRGDHGSLTIAHEAMQALVDRFPEAVRPAEIRARGKTASIERVIDPALMVETEKLKRADVALYERAQEDFQKWSVEAVMALKPQERYWLTDPQQDPVRRVAQKLLLAQATMTDETLSMRDRQQAGWLMARSLPAIRHRMPLLVQSWLDREKEQLAQSHLGALIFLTQSTAAASADEYEQFVERIPTQPLTDKEERIAKLAAEPPRPLENDEQTLLFAHNRLVGAQQTKLAEFIREQAPAIALHAQLLKRLRDLPPDPIARQIIDVFRPPESARTHQTVAEALARIGMPAQNVTSVLKIISQNHDRSM